MKFELGAKVKVTNKSNVFHEEVGTVIDIIDNNNDVYSYQIEFKFISYERKYFVIENDLEQVEFECVECKDKVEWVSGRGLCKLCTQDKLGQFFGGKL